MSGSLFFTDKIVYLNHCISPLYFYFTTILNTEETRMLIFHIPILCVPFILPNKLFDKFCVGFINPHLYALRFFFFFLLEVKIWQAVFLNKIPPPFFGCSLRPFPEVCNWLLQSHISKYTPPTELGKCSITKFKCNNSMHSNKILH